MFDGGSLQIDQDVMTGPHRAALPCDAEWKHLHQRLRSIAKRRVPLEAEEAGYLIEAEETQLYRRRATTMTERAGARALLGSPCGRRSAGARARATRAAADHRAVPGRQLSYPRFMS